MTGDELERGWPVAWDQVLAQHPERVLPQRWSSEPFWILPARGALSLERGRSQDADQRGREEEVLDADAMRPSCLRPGGERVDAVVGDHDQACPEAQDNGELARGREEAEDLAACPRGVVGESVADRSGGALRERGVGVCLELELERRPWRASSSSWPSTRGRSSLGVPSR